MKDIDLIKKQYELIQALKECHAAIDRVTALQEKCETLLKERETKLRQEVEFQNLAREWEKS